MGSALGGKNLLQGDQIHSSRVDLIDKEDINKSGQVSAAKILLIYLESFPQMLIFAKLAKRIIGRIGFILLIHRFLTRI